MKYTPLSTKQGSKRAVALTLLLLSSWTAAQGADEGQTSEAKQSSFFGLRKGKKKSAPVPASPDKPEAKQAKKKGAATELSAEEKKMVEAASRAAAAVKGPRQPAKQPLNATFAVQPRKPIWTPVVNIPASPADPNRQRVPQAPLMPTKYLPNTISSRTPAPPKTGAPTDPTKKR